MSNPLSTLLHCDTQSIYVNVFIPGNSINDLFIDGTDVTSEGTFVSSVTGAALSYTNWRDGEPNDAGDGEDCINMHGASGLWNDYSCTKSLPTVCELEGKFHRDSSMWHISCTQF